MWMEQQSRRLTGHMLALLLALLTAVLLGGAFGYELRASGFPSVSGQTTSKPAAVTAQHGQSSDAQARSDARRAAPVNHDEISPAQSVLPNDCTMQCTLQEMPVASSPSGADEAPQTTPASALEARKTLDRDILAAECRSAGGPIC